MTRKRKAKPAYYTRRMVTGQRTLPVTVTIAVRPLIKRRGPPAIGSCCFDEQDRLIYVTANPAIRTFTWHRVLTDGTLSRESYTGMLVAEPTGGG